MVKIAVLGAGINGMACAVRIKEKYKDFDVTVISEQFSPNTTGDGSGGLWYPYLCGDTPETSLTKWGGETYRYIHQLWLQGGYDVNLLPVYALYTDDVTTTMPEWAAKVFGYTSLDEKQLEYFGQLYNKQFRSGHTFTTFTVRPSTIISYLQSRFTRLGGKIVRARVTSLEDTILDGYLVVNCTGLGARGVAGDAGAAPIRGQISKVSAPWQNQAVLEQTSGHYILPNVNFCVLGGTHQEGDYNTKPDPKDTEFIFKGCTHMIPSLKSATVLNTWVGLRPGRSQVRIESQYVDGRLVIHNYGHGGSGLTLFWGCAAEVLQLLNNNINKSKL